MGAPFGVYRRKLATFRSKVWARSSLSDDGKHLAYTPGRDASVTLNPSIVRDLVSGEERELPDAKELENREIVFAPDASSAWIISYAVGARGPVQDVASVVELATLTTVAERKTARPYDGGPMPPAQPPPAFAFRSDSGSIAIADDKGIAIVDIRSTTVRAFTTPCGPHASAIAWSWDGKHLGVLGRRGKPASSALCVVDATTGKSQIWSLPKAFSEATNLSSVGDDGFFIRYQSGVLIRASTGQVVATFGEQPSLIQREGDQLLVEGHEMRMSISADLTHDERSAASSELALLARVESESCVLDGWVLPREHCPR